MKPLSRHMDQKKECFNAFQVTRISQPARASECEDGGQLEDAGQDDFACWEESVEDDVWEEHAAKEKFPSHAKEVSEEEILAMTSVKSSLPPEVEFRYALYALLNHPSIPLYVFPAVMRILNLAIISKHKDVIFSKQFNVGRTTTRDELQKLFPVPKAKSVPYTLKTKDDGPKESSLVVFDIKATMLQEVQNPLLWHLENLAIKGDRWYQHVPEVDSEGRINMSEAVSGRAYERAYKNHITDPGKELLVPFSCWIDESGVTGNLRHPVQPLLMRCLLLRRELQKNCVLSYIPCGTKSSAENKQDSSSELSRGINIQNFHAALSKVFQQWDKTARWFRKNPCQVTLGGSTAKMTIIPVILFFLGDHKSQLMLSCCYSNSTCSECEDAKTWLADDPHECLGAKVDTAAIGESNQSLLTAQNQMEDLERSLEEGNMGVKATKTLKRQLKDLKGEVVFHRKKLKSHHVIPCINAFSSFKHIARPINHCSPADHLHVFLLGIMKTSAMCTIGWFTDKEKKALDEHARDLFKLNSSSARKLFPRFYIEKGMTNLGNLTGSEWAGFFFGLLVVGRTDQGRRLLEKKALPHHYEKVKKESKARIQELELATENCKEESKMGPNNQMNMSKLAFLKKLVSQSEDASWVNFMECVEQMLLLHAFATQKQLWCGRDDLAKLERSLRQLVDQIVFCFPRVEGDCHKYPKMHLLKHLPENTAEYGAPINFDCMDGEKALQEFAKHLARTVVSTSDLTYFNQLLAKRLEDHLSVKKMADTLSSKDTPFLQIFNKTVQQRQKSSFDGYENEVELTEEEEEEEEEDEHLMNQIQGLPSKPHWWMSCRVERVNDFSTGKALEDRGAIVCQLVETDLRVFSTNKLKPKKIPEMCIRALKEDLVKWVQEAAEISPEEWKKFLPNHEKQKQLVVQGYFSCAISRGKEKHCIRCDPSFLNKTPRYDYVAEEHCNEKIPLMNKEGILENTATPSKVLMLYENPLDGDLRAVTHPCQYNVIGQNQKTTDVFKTSEIYHLDMKTKPFMEGLLFTEDGHSVSLNGFPPECFQPSFLEMSCIATTNGTQVSRLGSPVFCVQQNPGLLEGIDELLSREGTMEKRKRKLMQLTKINFMRNFREHWPSWFWETLPN